MQALGHAVREGQTNKACDVALVQAALVKITHVPAPGKPAVPYLARYDGAFGKGTGDAITAFQTDRKLSGAGVTPGQVAPGDATFGALAAALPTGFADLRVLPAGKLVYLGATQAELSNRLTQAAGETFSATFRPKVTATNRKLFADNGIAVGVDDDGGRRTLERQRVIRARIPKVTNTVPGESNHNFGGAVDLGFKGCAG
jgi:peptidoglycan hydrolase-like protein with peptidoglycan-binding domain